MERVFDNLLRNAVNYSYPNTVIQLSMEQRKEEHKVLLRVQNHGRTIAKEKLEHIFEQFFVWTRQDPLQRVGPDLA